ncbi:YwqH-like family protein [Salirhabdus sp. Marseille-P4669]|uniref:YwqH-like family protein n=1 Tax=Salirhabdus sp. Marseille-P4669 TaxID=2042310 RepID=UPI000C7D56A1|nr:DUF5082 family protein [Salirhabdus sp. Marseille-P4669]
MSYLASLLAKLEEKQEQLRRLNTCAGQLGSLQGEFAQNKPLVHDPELTNQTWKGSLANKFLNIREEMAMEYDDISNVQLSQSQSTLSSKIGQIQSEIESLYSSIAAERARLARLAAAEREGDGSIG